MEQWWSTQRSNFRSRNVGWGVGAGGCRDNPFGLESSPNLSLMLVGTSWRKAADAFVLFCHSSSPLSTDRLVVSHLVPDTKCTQITFINLGSHIFESMYILSSHIHVLLPCFLPFLPPCVPSFLLHRPFFQLEATAGNTAISGGRPGMAAQFSEAALQCETVTSS